MGTTPLALDRFYVALADAIAAEAPARFTALRLQGLDIVGHYFLRYAMPQAFGDVSEEERGRYGRVFEQYYAYVDAELGRLLDRLQPGDLLLVVSPFGLEPLSLPKRLLERTLGNPNISGTHERAPDGFLLAYGSDVKPGRYPAGRWSTSRRRCSTTTACRSAETWTASRAPTSSRRPSRPSGRLRTYRRMRGRAPRGCMACCKVCSAGAGAALGAPASRPHLSRTPCSPEHACYTVRSSLIAVPRDRKEVCHDARRCTPAQSSKSA